MVAVVVMGMSDRDGDGGDDACGDEGDGCRGDDNDEKKERKS